MDLKKTVEKHLKAWVLYDPDRHNVWVRDISGGVWLGYRTVLVNQIQISEYTHFDVNIIKETFFVLSIYLEQQHRGKGYGSALYKILESIAEEAGCDKVQMMPSGWTSTGESRKDYLLRRGYREFGTEVVKEV